MNLILGRSATSAGAGHESAQAPAGVQGPSDRLGHRPRGLPAQRPDVCCCSRRDLGQPGLVNVLPFRSSTAARWYHDRQEDLRARGVSAFEAFAYVASFGLLLAFMAGSPSSTYSDQRPVAMRGFDLESRRKSRRGRRRRRRRRGGHPIVVQSIDEHDTADADATAIQVARLAHAAASWCGSPSTPSGRGSRSEIVRKVRAWARPCRSSATSITTATSAARLPETARPPKYRINPGSRVGAITTITSKRSSGSPSRTTSRSGSG